MPVDAASAAVATTGLSRGLRAAIYWRALALQAAWNPQRMQNLGLAAALAPWLRRRAPALPLARRFCRRHYEYFNTNPYLANFIVGGVLRLEEENLRAGGRQNRLVLGFKSSLARAFASLGDQLFWLGLQPAVLMLSCLLGLAGRTWEGLLPVALFGAAQLLLRWRALATGYALGLEIVDLLSRPVWHRAIRAAQLGGLLLAGVLAGASLARAAGGPDRMALLAVGGMGAAAAGLFLLRRRWPGELILLLGIPVALILTCL